MAVVLFGIVAGLAHLFLRFTRQGRFIYAIGDNRDTAQITGIAVRPIIVSTYIFGALLALLAGLVLAAQVGQLDTATANSTLVYDVVTVAVIGGVSLAGGRGSVLSVLAGTILIGLLLNGMTLLHLSSDVQVIVKGFALLLALGLDSALHPRDEETARHGDL